MQAACLVLVLCLRRAVADVPIVGLDHNHDIAATDASDGDAVYDFTESQQVPSAHLSAWRGP